MPRKNKLPVTAILGNSIVKDVKVWKLSDEKNKVMVKHFIGAKTKDMESYVIRTLEQNPEIFDLLTTERFLITISITVTEVGYI